MTEHTYQASDLPQVPAGGVARGGEVKRDPSLQALIEAYPDRPSLLMAGRRLETVITTPEDFPTPCTLYFQSPLDRVRFLHHLDDNLCHAETAEDRWTREEWRSGQAFEECERFTVYVATDETMEDLRWGKLHPDTRTDWERRALDLAGQLQEAQNDLVAAGDTIDNLRSLYTEERHSHEFEEAELRAERDALQAELEQPRNTIKAMVLAQKIGEEE